MNGPRPFAAALLNKRQRCKTVELVKPLHGRTLSWCQDLTPVWKIKPKNIEWRFLRVEPRFFDIRRFATQRLVPYGSASNFNSIRRTFQ